MKYIVPAALAVAAATVPVTASAAPVISYTTNVGGTFGNPDPTNYPPLFSDVFTFVTTLPRTASVSVFSNMPTPTTFGYNINFLFNGVKLDTAIIPTITKGQYELVSLVNYLLPAGTHTILVQGSAGRDASYNGTLTLAGVPEPATWAMMIIGFGFAAGMMRRRSSQQKLAAA